VLQANTARHAYEIWEQAGVLRVAGDRLCTQVQDVLQRFTEGALDAEVAMVDFSGRHIVAATRPEWVAA
jgi:cobalt-precorrin-5B (C1)-methyltransferase